MNLSESDIEIEYIIDFDNGEIDDVMHILKYWCNRHNCFDFLMVMKLKDDSDSTKFYFNKNV